MTAIVAAHAEAVVLDFLSVLEDTLGAPLTVFVTTSFTRIELGNGESLRGRLDTLARYVGRSTRATVPRAPEMLEWLAGTLDIRAHGVVWTHSPADERAAHRDTCRASTQVAGSRRCCYAVGSTSYMQVSAVVVRPLPPALLSEKLNFVNDWCGDLLNDEDAESAVTTSRAPATELFHLATAEQVERACALMSILGEGAAAVVDPWDFATSSYERTRLIETARWVAASLPPGATVVELGACEGHLTRRLVDLGLKVVATEPNDAFRSRLTCNVTPGVPVGPESLEDLAAGDAPPADAYLLIEMLYGYGQELEQLLEPLPTHTIFISLPPEHMGPIVTWLRRQHTWTVTESSLAAPRLEMVAGGLAHQVKHGSRGLLLSRAHGEAIDLAESAASSAVSPTS